MSEKTVTIKRAIRNEDHPFFPTSRAAAQNVSLSYEAAGMLWYLLSKPDTWKVIPGTLLRKGTKRGRVYNILNELIEARYIERIEVKEKGKFKDVEYIIHEIPYNEKPCAEKPDTVNPDTVLPDTEKQHNRNNRLVGSTDLENESGKPAIPQSPQPATSVSPEGESAVSQAMEHLAETDKARILQHYETLTGRKPDAKRAEQVTIWLGAYSAEWIMSAITEAHETRKQVSTILAKRQKDATKKPRSDSQLKADAEKQRKVDLIGAAWGVNAVEVDFSLYMKVYKALHSAGIQESEFKHYMTWIRGIARMGKWNCTLPATIANGRVSDYVNLFKKPKTIPQVVPTTTDTDAEAVRKRMYADPFGGS